MPNSPLSRLKNPAQNNYQIRHKHLTAAQLQEEVYDCCRSVYSLSRAIRSVLLGPRGFRLAGLGEAVYRHLEWLK